MTTYGDTAGFPGVKLSTVGGDNVVAQPDPDMTEQEYRLTTILIMMTLKTREEVTRDKQVAIGVDVTTASNALQCFGYDVYEARPMVWETLEEIGRRCYE